MISQARLPAVRLTEGAPVDIRALDWGGASPTEVAGALEKAGSEIERDLRLRGNPLKVQRSAGSIWLRVSGLAGFISVAKRAVQIAPKFATSEEAIESWEQCIVSMLRRARRKGIFALFPAPELSVQRLRFLDHVALAFSSALERAEAGDPIRVFQNKAEEGQFLRGTLDTSRQLQSSLTKPHILHFRVDTLDSDNPFNHLLQWAGRLLLRLAFDGTVIRRLESALDALPALPVPPQLPAHLPGRPPPQFANYFDAVDIASMVVRGTGHGQSAGQLGGYGYALDMESIFEGFIERSLRHVSPLAGPYHAVAQVTRRYATSLSNRRNYFTRPDNVLYEGEQPKLLVDAKYKLLGDTDSGAVLKPLNSDVYQMVASLVSQRCPRGLLIYPRLEGDSLLGDGTMRWWSVDETPYLVGAIALSINDIGNSNGIRAFDHALAHSLREAIAFSGQRIDNPTRVSRAEQ